MHYQSQLHFVPWMFGKEHVTYKQTLWLPSSQKTISMSNPQLSLLRKQRWRICIVGSRTAHKTIKIVILHMIQTNECKLKQIVFTRSNVKIACVVRKFRHVSRSIFTSGLRSFSFLCYFTFKSDVLTSLIFRI